MFTRKRITLPSYTGDSRKDFDSLKRAISDYLLSLEGKQSLTLDSATGLDNTPVGAHTASTGAFTIVGIGGSVSGTERLLVKGTTGDGARIDMNANQNHLIIAEAGVDKWVLFSNGGTLHLSTPAGTDRLEVTQAGNIVPGAAALATTATDGFTYIETCAGAPTGVPTTFTGRVPMVYDSTNNKLYVYNGAWKSVTLA